MTEALTSSSDPFRSSQMCIKSAIGPVPCFGTPPPRATLSFINVVTAAAQPPPTSPKTFS